jgi:hypothetical protein
MAISDESLIAAKRGYVPTTTFYSYDSTDGSPRVKAAKPTKNDIERFRKYWDRPDIEVGDFAVLEHNGSLKIYKPEAFQELYKRA